MQAASSSNAIQNNQRLFGLFSKKLASDDQAIYAAFAEKFAVWLSDERAYYLGARPEILKILKIAQSTLRRNVGANVDLKSPFHISSCIEHPMVASYSRLLRAIHPFRDRFVEPDLQAEIKLLLRTITAPISRKVNSVNLTTDAQSPTPRIISPPKHNSSTSKQPSSPSPVSGLQERPSLSPHMQAAHDLPGVVQASFQTPSLNSAVAANGRTTIPLPAVAGNAVLIPHYYADPLQPAVVSSPSQSVSIAPTLASLAFSKQPERTPLKLSTASLQDPVQITRPAFKQTRSPTRHTPIPATTSVAPSKPRKKKKLDVGLESLIQVDLQELRKRGVTVKQELTEPTNLFGTFDASDTQTLTVEGASGATESMPATQNASDALAGTTTKPQLEVIILDHDDVRGFAGLGAQNIWQINATMSTNGLGGHSSLPMSSSNIASAAMATDITETEHGSDSVIDDPSHPTPRLYNESHAGAAFRRASVDDIEMANGAVLGSTGPITKTDLQVDETVPQAGRVAPPPLPQMDLPHADSATDGTNHDTMQSTPSNRDARCGVPVIPHATPNAAVDVETGKIRSEIMGSSLLREPRTGVVCATSAISSRLDAEISKPRRDKNMAQCNRATPATTLTPSASEVRTQHFPMPAHRHRDTVHEVGSMPESQVSIHNDLDISVGAAMPISRPGSTPPTASVIPNVVLPPGMTHPTSTRDIGAYVTASQSRKALEPVGMNSVSSIIDKPSEGPAFPSGLILSAPNITGVELQHVSEKGGTPSVSVSEVEEHSAEELRALHAFGPGTVTFAVHKGLAKRSKAIIRFDIPEGQFEALNLWTNRKDSTKDLKDSLCLTLSCYSRVSVKAETKTLEEVCALPSMWPTTGDLSMNVMYEGKRTNFPLSPPFIVAPNGLVDVSDFLQTGSNIIELDQIADMSAYIFILRAHRPTGAQLEQVAQRRRKNQAWKDWLLRMSQPFEVPTPIAS